MIEQLHVGVDSRENGSMIVRRTCRHLFPSRADVQIRFVR